MRLIHWHAHVIAFISLLGLATAPLSFQTVVLEAKRVRPPANTSVFCLGMFLFALLMAGCAHYPLNQPLAKFVSPSEDRARSVEASGRSEDLFFMLSFSGGGTTLQRPSFQASNSLSSGEQES